MLLLFSGTLFPNGTSEKPRSPWSRHRAKSKAPNTNDDYTPAASTKMLCHNNCDVARSSERGRCRWHGRDQQRRQHKGTNCPISFPVVDCSNRALPCDYHDGADSDGAVPDACTTLIVHKTADRPWPSQTLLILRHEGVRRVLYDGYFGFKRVVGNNNL